MPIIRSLSTAAAASGLPYERGESSAVGRGRSGKNRTDHGQQHCYHHAPTVNQCSVPDQGFLGPVPPVTETLQADSRAVTYYLEDGRLTFGGWVVVVKE